MRGMKRILAMLLAVVMVVGLIPATVFAADTVQDAAIFCSDVHGSTSDLTSVLGGVKKSGVDYSSIGFVGDTCLTVANTTSIVQSALGDTDIAVMFSYAKSHDTENGADISTKWNYSGEVEGVSNYYLVYTICETDMQNNTTAEANFTTWYNGLTAAEKALPIFIMSHRPLHARRGDNANAADWYNVISAAAESSDIVFFWGHNHTGDNSVDQAAYYVAKDGSETMTIYNGSTVTPNFTYMNAGYINANGQNPARKGIATTVQITANSLIFQDYNSSGEYSGTYAHNVTVAREFAAPVVTLESIAISGKTAYAVGDELDLTVTATYSDGTTADVTADAELSGYNMTVGGAYTVTATYEGKTAAYAIKINPITLSEWDDTQLILVKATANDLTKLTVINVYGEPDLSDIFSDYMSVEVTVEGAAEAAQIAYSMQVLEEIPTTGLVLYHVADDGTLTPINYTLSTSESGGIFLNFTTDLTGVFAYGIVTVPVGYVLDSLKVENSGKVDYFVGNTLNLTGLTVVATYTKEGAEDFTRVIYIKDDYATFDGYTVSGYDMTKAGEQAVIVTYENCTDSFDIYVWGTEITNGEITVALDKEGSEYGVAGVNVTQSNNANVANAIQYVITGDNYVAYDISLAYEKGYSATKDAKTVTLPIPAGVTNPVVYYVPVSGTAEPVTITEKTATTVTFETDHFSTYVVGESTKIDVADPETATGSGSTTTTVEKEVYVLVSSISGAGDYLIVNTNSATTSAHMLTATSNGVTDTSNVTVVSGKDADGNTVIYIEDPASAAIWTATVNSSGYRLRNTSSTNRYLRYNNGLTTTSQSNSATTWYSGTNTVYRTSNNSSRYLRYNSGWTTSTSSQTVYIYQKQTVEFETTTTVSGTYAIDGTPDELRQVVKAGSTATLGATLTFTPTSGTVTTTDVSATATYEVVTADKNGNPVDGDPNDVITGISGNTVTFTGNTGKALVKVSCTTDFGVVTDYITVYASEPYYSIDLHKAEVDADGNVSVGDEITEIITRKNVKAGDTYSVWAVIKEYNAEYPNGKDLGDVEDGRIYWTISDESIATIDEHTGVITFTGDNYGTITVTARYLDEDGDILCEDSITISASVTSATVPEDGTNDFPEYPNEGAVRHDKTATAVGNFSETGVAKIELSMTGVPYTKGSEIDVVVMLDITGSMTDTDDRIPSTIAAAKVFVESIVVNKDGSYNNNRVAVYCFNKNGATLMVDLGTVSSDEELKAVNAAIEDLENNYASGGTPYDDGLGKCQEVLAAAKTDGIGNNRQQFCVFMTDGVPTDFEYVNGTSHANYSSASSVAGMLTSASDYATRDTDYKYEYYSTEMKKAGVTVYSVGLGLFNKNSAWSGTATQCGNLASALLNDISGPGGETTQPDAVGTSTLSKKDKYFFSVDDADAATEMEKVFSDIAQDILAAATDVTVADKMGSNYTMIFDAPNAVVEEADGGQEYYIEVTDYELVPVYAADGETVTDYKRGTGTSMLKLYFSYNDTTGYYAATDANGTKAATPVFEQVTLGDKGTKYYWSTTAADGDSGVSVVGADGNTYYFVASGTGTHNMTSGAFASGTKTTVNLTYDDGTTATSATCQNMIIASPYFVYNAETKMLIWTLEEIADNEMTLTYFLYLNNSGGFSGTDNETKPETYETNQFAYVDYINYKKNECLLKFPEPQMTWNGAQVSYVFYLVNDQGLPVNRAGRVVPFSEAVYVTDVYTHAVVWNDLEQTVGLEAEHLAADLVPDVYDLFDHGAEYSIHVYEDQEKVNLNNHFVIESGVSNRVYTTYVFNTKADAQKYNVPGAYVMDNGNNTAYQTNQGYLCKNYDVTGTFEKTENYDELYGTFYTYTVTSASYTGTETRVPASSMTSTTGGTIIDGYVYYVDEEERIYTIVQKNDGTEVEAGFDFSNTTVAFAVVWKPQLVEDTVVVDFGLDVVIDVIANDGMAAGVTGVMLNAPDVAKDGTYETSVGAASISSNDGLWTASVANMNEVRFHMNKMGIDAPVSFYYEAGVNYYPSGSDTLKSTNMYSKVTVIPATTIYYEDSFVTFTNSGKATETVGKWTQEGTATNKTQATDRPGPNKLSSVYDADNVYGYDAAYKTMSQYSMGSAMKVTVAQGISGMASFDFYGTGFDVISMTDSTTGMILVQVFDENGQKVKDYAVNTYYGYAYGLYEATYTYSCVQAADETAGTEAICSWVKTSSKAVDAAGTNGQPTAEPKEGDTYVTYETGWYPNATDNALYQVPVIKISGMEYGKYTVKVIASYNTPSDVNRAGQYNFYLDGIRIYDPTGVVAGEDKNDVGGVVSDAYIADGEMDPTYVELRNNILSVNDFNAAEAGQQSSGAIFIDQAAKEYTIADYTSYGPNNEMYLANGQAIAFNVADAASAKDIQLGIKSANGDAVTYSINGDSYTVSTATDMYYSIAKYAKAGTVVIENVSGGILSLTNIKVTAAPVDTAELLWMDGETATFALRFLSRSPVSDGSDTGDNEGDDTTTDNNTNNNTNTNTGNTGNNGNADAEQNGTVSGETVAPESNGTVNDAPETDEPAEEKPEEELPKEDVSDEEIPEDSLTTGAVVEQLGFWARLWNAIKNVFKQLFTSLGF